MNAMKERELSVHETHWRRVPGFIGRAVRRAANGMAILIAVLATHSAASAQRPQAPVQLPDFALSNDGRLLAVSRDGTIGLLDWRADKLVVLPPSTGVRSMGGPTFSPDGRSLAAVIGHDGEFAIFDLATLQATQVHKSDCWFRSSPAFQPDGNAVLYSTGGFPEYFCLYDFSSRTTSIPLKREDGFYATGEPVFVAPNKVLFAGMGPRNSSVASSVESLGASKTSGFVPYHLEIGGMPEIVYPELVRRGVQLTKGMGSGPGSFAASRNGDRVVFIDRSLTEEDRVARGEFGRFRYDLFMIEGGVTRQITHLEAYLARLAISYDGHTVAFGIQSTSTGDPSDARRLDLIIMDLRTNVLTRIDLIARLDAEPRFNGKSP